MPRRAGAVRAGPIAVSVFVGDVRDAVAAQSSAALDGILLDVDNGPDFLVYDENAAIYESSSCRVQGEASRGRRTDCLVLVALPALESAVQACLRQCEVKPVPVQCRAAETYYVYQASS